MSICICTLHLTKYLSSCRLYRLAWQMPVCNRQTAKSQMSICIDAVDTAFILIELIVLWSPAGKTLISWLSCVWCFIVFCCFPVWCPWSGVVPHCNNFRTLPSFLLLIKTAMMKERRCIVISSSFRCIGTQF